MTNVMIKVGDESAESYIGALKHVDPSLNILEWPNYGNPDEIDVATVSYTHLTLPTTLQV